MLYSPRKAVFCACNLRVRVPLLAGMATGTSSSVLRAGTPQVWLRAPLRAGSEAGDRADRMPL